MALTATARMTEAAQLYGDGHTLNEIAAALGITHRTAKYLVTEARRRAGIAETNARGRRALRAAYPLTPKGKR